MNRNTIRRATVGVLAAALASTALASTVTTAGAATSTAQPTKVMVIGDLTSQSIGFTVPEIVPSVKAALKGVPNVEIESCDSKGDAATGESCAKKAVDGGVDAVIYGFGQGGLEILKAAGIPVLGNGNTTDANSFPTASAFALYTANGVALAESGCKRLGILYLDGTDFLVDYVKQGAESAGAREVARAAIAANAPDLTPAIAKLTGAGAQCVALSVIPAQVVQAVTAVNQTGKKLQMAGVSAIFTEEVVNSLGDLANGIIIVDNLLNAKDPDAKAIKKVTKKIKAVDSSAEITQVGLISYVGGKLLATALPNVQGDVTPASLTTALNGLRDQPVEGLIHPYSSIELANPTFVRFFNHYGISYKIVKGVPKAQTEFFDLADVLDSAE